ncbi:MAG: MBL fold metallo-hydrolase [Thermoguttaceae bacterium]|nr:MBL fold metallo-hydrolase [Thermoguttaceae bacterium]
MNLFQTRGCCFCPIASGSSGNATYVEADGDGILIDCACSGKKIEQALSELGTSIRNVRGIFITHGHHDHYGSIGVLARRHKIPIYANAPTWQRIRDDNTSGRHVTGKIDPDLIQVTDTLFTGPTVTLGALTITSFPVPHDCPGAVGYRVRLGGRTAVVMTDLGYIPRELEDEVLGASVILLESNHDTQMLRNGPYPGYLKNRILSNSGHLSNDAAGLFAVKLARGGTGRIYLGHLSKVNNTPGQALATVSRHLIDARITPNRDVELLVAQREILSAPTRW